MRPMEAKRTCVCLGTREYIAHVNKGTNFTWKCHWLCWHWSSDRRTTDDERLSQNYTHFSSFHVYQMEKRTAFPILLSTKWKEREKQETNMWIDRFTINTALRCSTQHLAHNSLCPTQRSTMNGYAACVCAVCGPSIRFPTCFEVNSSLGFCIFPFYSLWVSECCFLFPFNSFSSVFFFCFVLVHKHRPSANKLYSASDGECVSK